MVLDFTSKTKSDVTNWGSKFSNTVAIYFEYEESELEAGTIIRQSVKEGTTVKELLEKNTTITFTIAKEKQESSQDDETTNDTNEEKES